MPSKYHWDVGCIVVISNSQTTGDNPAPRLASSQKAPQSQSETHEHAVDLANLLQTDPNGTWISQRSSSTPGCQESTWLMINTVQSCFFLKFSKLTLISGSFDVNLWGPCIKPSTAFVKQPRRWLWEAQMQSKKHLLLTYLWELFESFSFQVRSNCIIFLLNLRRGIICMGRWVCL